MFPDLKPVLPEWLLYTLVTPEATVWIVARSQEEAVSLSGLKTPQVEWANPLEVVEITLPWEGFRSDLFPENCSYRRIGKNLFVLPDGDEDDEYFDAIIIAARAQDWCNRYRGLIAVEREDA